MKSSSPPSSSSSSVSSTSVTAAPDTQLLSSSPSPLPRLSLRSPELQAEFLRECWNKFPSHHDGCETGIIASAASPPSPLPSPCSSSSSSSSSSPCINNRQARLSLSSPELLSELSESRTRSLRHVKTRHGLTTVFCGRGRGGRGGRRGGGSEASGSASSSPSANHKPPR